jgi:hypothetical protein
MPGILKKTPSWNLKNMVLKIKKLQALAKTIYPMLMEYSLKQGVSYKNGPFGIP